MRSTSSSTRPRTRSAPCSATPPRGSRGSTDELGALRARTPKARCDRPAFSRVDRDAPRRGTPWLLDSAPPRSLGAYVARRDRPPGTARRRGARRRRDDRGRQRGAAASRRPRPAPRAASARARRLRGVLQVLVEPDEAHALETGLQRVELRLRGPLLLSDGLENGESGLEQLLALLVGRLRWQPLHFLVDLGHRVLPLLLERAQIAFQ